MKPKFKFPEALKYEICSCIKKNYMGSHCVQSIHKFQFYVHFDVMLYKKGFFSGYVDTWSGWRSNPYGALRKRRRRFVVEILDYEEKVA